MLDSKGISKVNKYLLWVRRVWLVFRRAGAINVHQCGLEPFKPVQAVDLAAGLPESN